MSSIWFNKNGRMHVPVQSMGILAMVIAAVAFFVAIRRETTSRIKPVADDYYQQDFLVEMDIRKNILIN